MEKNSNNLAVGMTVFGAIFFIFGFATTFIITLTAPVKAIFGLSEFGAQLLSSAFFLAYPLMSIPTGKIIDREQSYVLLQLFIPYCKKMYQLMDHYS